MTAVARTSICPSCGTEITSDPSYTTWCQACDWNVDPQPAKPLGRIQRIVTARSDKLAMRLFEHIRAHPESQRRGKLTAATVWSLAIAVHLVTAAVLAAAVLLALSSFFMPFRVAGAAILVMIAGYVQPFRWRREPGRVTVTRQNAPVLVALIDEVATAIGAAPVHVVRLSSDFNARYFKTRRGRTGIGLGLTLWSILEPHERVALIGHELGHGVNGDLRSTRLVNRALISLNAWYELLRPSTRRNTMGRSRAPVSGLVTFTEFVLAPIILAPIVILIVCFGRTLALIANRHGQRCEYYADELSARAAGTAGAVGLSEKILIGDVCRRVLVQAARFSRGADPWRTIKAEVDAIPLGEWERRRRLARRRLNRIDVSHPPTQLRADLLRERPSRPATVTLTPERSEAIDAELAPGAKVVEAGVHSALGIASRIAWG